MAFVLVAYPLLRVMKDMIEQKAVFPNAMTTEHHNEILVDCWTRTLIN